MARYVVAIGDFSSRFDKDEPAVHDNAWHEACRRVDAALCEAGFVKLKESWDATGESSQYKLLEYNSNNRFHDFFQIAMGKCIDENIHLVQCYDRLWDLPDRRKSIDSKNAVKNSKITQDARRCVIL